MPTQTMTHPLSSSTQKTTVDKRLLLDTAPKVRSNSGNSTKLVTPALRCINTKLGMSDFTGTSTKLGMPSATGVIVPN